MLLITNTSAAKKTMAAVLIAFAAMANWSSASASTGDTCAFVKQLEEPAESYHYRTRLNAAWQASKSQYGEFAADNPISIVRDGETYEIDSFSFDCLSCHDGSTSPIHAVSYKRAADSGTFSGSGLKSHPIGTHYGSASYINPQLQRLENLHPNMVLIDGRVGCLTCHNPFNKTAPHLVVANDNSNLCLACHIK